MNLLLAFAPFVAFAVVDRLVGSFPGLCAGAAASLVIIARELVVAGRQPKLLEIGTCLLFVGLAIYAWVQEPDWSVIAVRLLVDMGLLIIVIFSLLVGRPFSAQYARDAVPKEYWESSDFKNTNFVISAVWALAFLIMVLAELALLFIPDMPHRLGIIVIILALGGAFKFTGWYPTRQRSHTM